MLAFASAVTAFGYANVGFGLNGRLPSGMAEYMITFAVLLAVAHAAARVLAPQADPLLLPLAAVLNGLGIVMTYRLQQVGRDGNPGTLSVPLSGSAVTTQILFTAVGIGCFIAVLVLVREPRVLQRWTYSLGAAGLVLLALPAMLPPRISEIPDTNTRIQIALGGLTVQPAEFAKLALAVSFAGYFTAKRGVLSLAAGRRVLGIDLPRARDFGPVLIAWVGSLLVLIFESDIGTSALFLGLFVVMLYLATSRTSWLLAGAALFLAGAVAASELISRVGQRVQQWLFPFAAANINGISFQLDKGLEGLAYGGVLGRGLGGGMPYLTPLVQSDFVITAFGEELGLTGLMAILLIYGLIVQRGLAAALAVKDPFSKLLAGGLAFLLAFEVFVTVGGVTRLIPETGLPAPFLSQGGSSLVANWTLIAVLVRISDTARRPVPQPIQDEGMTEIVRIP